MRALNGHRSPSPTFTTRDPVKVGVQLNAARSGVRVARPLVAPRSILHRRRMDSAPPTLTRRLSLRVEEDQAVALERLATARRRTVAQELRHLIDVALGHRPELEEAGR
jgi:hypothetical protein